MNSMRNRLFSPFRTRGSFTTVFLVLLIALRTAIGWHFLYEGLAKLFVKGWSAEGYLTMAKWVFGDVFRWMAENPHHSIGDYTSAAGLGRRPDNWRDRVARWVAESRPDHPDGSDDQKIRFLLGAAMSELRGRVPAREVEDAIRTEMGAIHD